MSEQLCPRPCVECPDAQHHWLDSCTDEDGNPVDPHYACKHCDATTGVCDECVGPLSSDKFTVCDGCLEERSEA